MVYLNFCRPYGADDIYRLRFPTADAVSSFCRPYGLAYVALSGALIASLKPIYFFAKTTGACSVARMRSKKLRTAEYWSAGMVMARMESVRVKRSCPALTS
jgi:hypothetical protein